MAKLSMREKVLDVGSGEGLVAAEMASRTGRPVYALDLAPGSPPPPSVRTVAGDARALPFPEGSLDAVAFHFLLLWLPDPLAALREARRVLKPQGVAMILAEPDLSARVDEPDTGMGRAIAGAVLFSGGHLDVGAWLEEGLRRAGFRPTIRAAAHEWTPITDPAEAEHEVAFLRDQGRLSSKEALSMAAAERAAILSGLRRVRLPIYYGMGLKG